MGNLIGIAGAIATIASIIWWVILLVKNEDPTRALFAMWIGIVVMRIGIALM